MKGWFEQFGRILSEPLTGAGSEWGVKLEVLRLLTLLTARFGRLCSPHVPAVMAHAWHLFVGVYTCVEHDPCLITITMSLENKVDFALRIKQQACEADVIFF